MARILLGDLGGRAQGPAPLQPAGLKVRELNGRRGVIPLLVETAAAQVVEVLDPATRQYFDTAVESERRATSPGRSRRTGSC
jgi:hypothetical protein